MNAVPVLANEDEDDEQQEEKFLPTNSSSSNSLSFSSSLSTDFELIRIVMTEVTEYLQTVEPSDCIDDRTIQRIATIVLTHMNNSINERLFLTSCRKIDREELIYNLRLFATKREKFHRKLEFYLKHHFFLSESKYQRNTESLPNDERDPERDEVENVEVLRHATPTTVLVFPKKQNNNFPAQGDYLEKIPNAMPAVPPRNLVQVAPLEISTPTREEGLFQISPVTQQNIVTTGQDEAAAIFTEPIERQSNSEEERPKEVNDMSQDMLSD